jgi:SSS family solute:Na+ symporter
MAGLAYAKGLPGAWWLLVGAIGLAVGGALLAGKVRKTRAYTLPEILGKSYGEGARKAASIIILASWLGIIAGQMIAAGKIMSVLFPHLSVSLLIAASGAVMIFYTLLGGQYSVLRTDAIQALLILIGVAVMVVLGMHASGGITAIARKLPPDFLSFPSNRSISWGYIGNLFLFVGTAYLVGPDIFSRFLSAKNSKSARNAAWITAAVLVVVAFSIAGIGIMARILYPGIAAERAFPTMVVHILPGIFPSLVTAALLAAVMSSADTCLLTAGVIMTSDIFGKWLTQKGANDKGILLTSRLFVLVLGILSMGIALYMQGIIKSLLLGYTVFTAGLIIPVLLALFTDRFPVRPAWAVSAIILGGGTALWGKLAHFPQAGLAGMGLCLVMMIIGIIQGKRLGNTSQDITAAGGESPPHPIL